MLDVPVYLPAGSNGRLSKRGFGRQTPTLVGRSCDSWKTVAVLADRQKTQGFNEKYGVAIRSLREERGLKQSTVDGVTERHLRRVEHGQQPVSKGILEALATAHGMPLEEYPNALADRLGQRA